MKNLKNYLFEYQKKWLKDKSRFKIWEKSRRIGATYVQSLEDVLDCISQKLAVWFSSADDSAAKEYILYCGNWSKMANAAASAIDTEIIDEKDGITAYTINFNNGSRIHAMSSNPKGFRSKGGKVVLDEFAWHKDQEQLWTAAKPVISWGNSLRIFSTHNGKQSLFYKFTRNIKEGKQKWSLHTTSIYDAVKQGLADRITGKKLTEDERQKWLEDERQNCNSEEMWQQEYCCNPVDEASAFLTFEQILAAERPEEEILQPLTSLSGEIYIGFDIARKKDLSVIWLLEKAYNILITRKVIILRNTPFSKQKTLLFDILKNPQVRRCCIDATGLGMNLAEDAEKMFGNYKVEKVSFNAAVKEELATDLRIRFEDKSIIIPALEEIRNDLHSIKKVTTAAGNVRFDVSQTETDGHADRFWALALAVHAAKDSFGSAMPFVRTGNPRESSIIFQRY